MRQALCRSRKESSSSVRVQYNTWLPFICRDWLPYTDLSRIQAASFFFFLYLKPVTLSMSAYSSKTDRAEWHMCTWFSIFVDIREKIKGIFIVYTIRTLTFVYFSVSNPKDWDVIALGFGIDASNSQPKSIWYSYRVLDIFNSCFCILIIVSRGMIYWNTEKCKHL